MDSVNPDPKNIPDDDLLLQNYQDDLDTSSQPSKKPKQLLRLFSFI